MSSRHTLTEQLSPMPQTGGKAALDDRAPRLPEPCGPLSEIVLTALTAPARRRPVPRESDVRDVADPLGDRDFQLALWMLYELHLGGFDGLDRDAEPDLEWDPLLLLTRRMLETRHDEAVREIVDLPDPMPTTARELVRTLTSLTTSSEEPRLAAYLAREATTTQFTDFLAERAVYHLREADAQCFLLARLGGGAKVALAEVQYDEYGAGRPDRLHAELYAQALASLGLPTDLGSYLAGVGAETLASINTSSMFNLSRSRRGAAAGHFAAFEATSSVPCRLIAEGAERLELPAPVFEYFDEHVEADSVHERIAIDDVCGRLVESAPELIADVVLGASACLAVDALAADALLTRVRELPPDDDRMAS